MWKILTIFILSCQSCFGMSRILTPGNNPNPNQNPSEPPKPYHGSGYASDVTQNLRKMKPGENVGIWFFPYSPLYEEICLISKPSSIDNYLMEKFEHIEEYVKAAELEEPTQIQNGNQSMYLMKTNKLFSVKMNFKDAVIEGFSKNLKPFCVRTNLEEGYISAVVNSSIIIKGTFEGNGSLFGGKYPFRGSGSWSLNKKMSCSFFGHFNYTKDDALALVEKNDEGKPFINTPQVRCTTSINRLRRQGRKDQIIQEETKNIDGLEELFSNFEVESAPTKGVAALQKIVLGSIRPLVNDLTYRIESIPISLKMRPVLSNIVADALKDKNVFAMMAEFESSSKGENDPKNSDNES